MFFNRVLGKCLIKEKNPLFAQSMNWIGWSLYWMLFSMTQRVSNVKKTILSLLILLIATVIGSTLIYAKTSLSSNHKSVSYEFAKKVAARYGTARWPGSQIGEGELYYAPDGMPEVYFFILFKKDIEKKSLSALLEETTVLRDKRVEAEGLIKNAPANVMKEQSVAIKDIWRQMSAADKYGTVVVGAHEGREPFIASYSGLPHHIFLNGDAIETANIKFGRKKPKNIRFIWQPPLFITFDISEKGKEMESVSLQVRGTELRHIKLLRRERPKLQENVLQKRKQKWQSLRGALSEN